MRACPQTAQALASLNLIPVEEEVEEEGEGEGEMEVGSPFQMDNLPVDATMPLSCRGRYRDRGTTPAAWGEED